MSNSKNPLDKFDSRIVDIVLKLVQEEDVDPQDAAMDILDIINEKMLKEDIQWRAGIVEQAPRSKAWMTERAIDKLRETPITKAHLDDIIQILHQDIRAQ